MDRCRRAVFVAALLGAELAAVITLHRLGRIEGFAPPRREIGHWLLHAPTEDLVAATARLVVALAWWLLVATVLSLARRVVPRARRLRALDSMSPVALRRLVDQMVAVGLGASLGLTGMHTAGAATEPGRARVDTPVVRSSSTSSPVPTPPATSTARPPATSAAPPADTLVVVRAGDNLWVIARKALENGTRVVGPAEIAPYWRRVVAANTGHLRSDDPNLIFPGERVVLPPVRDGGNPVG